MVQIADFLPAGPTGAQVTEVARRRARFKYARDRVRKIAVGTPEFTWEELTELAEVFLSRASQVPGPDPVTASAGGATVRE